MDDCQIEQCVAAGYWPNEKRKPDEVWDIILTEEQERKERRKCKHQSKNQRN